MTLALILLNLITFLLYGIDKFKSKFNFWRISEKTLLLFSILGGGMGGFLAMTLLRHKTLKNKFYIANFIGIFVFIFIVYKRR